MDSSVDYRLVFALMNGKVSHALNRRLNENFRKAGLRLTAEQWDVMLTITMHDTVTQQQLCDSTSFNKTMMTRLLDAMEDMKLIERFKSRTDWRSNYIRITRYGFQIHEKAQTVAIKTFKESVQGMTHEEISMTQKGLNRVMNNLINWDEEPESEEKKTLMKMIHGHKRDL